MHKIPQIPFLFYKQDPNHTQRIRNDYLLFDLTGEGRKGTDEEELRRILVSYSYQQLRDVFSEYHKLAGKTLGEALDDELSGDLRDAMKAACKWRPFV